MRWTSRGAGDMVASRVDRDAHVSDAKQNLQRAYQRLDESGDLVAAAECLKAAGRCIGMPHPAVIDDYSSNRLLTIEDGRTLTSVLGWETDFVEQYLSQKLYLVSPIAAVCRMSTKPFSWDALAIEAAIQEARSRTIEWPLTPARGVYGGITVPIHLPRGRTGSVSWYSRDPDVNIPRALEDFGDLLRLVGHRFMDLVYAHRAETESEEQARLHLSERELECLTWAALGRTDADIGAVIHRSPATARFHIDNAVRKLGARNRTQAVAIAAQRGLIHPLDGSPGSSAQQQ